MAYNVESKEHFKSIQLSPTQAAWSHLSPLMLPLKTFVVGGTTSPNTTGRGSWNAETLD
jgi:hypothetical protein